MTPSFVEYCYIRYLQLACHESENLYLSDEVLSDMGTTWNEAKLEN